LSETDALHNRQILRSFFAFETAVASTRELARLAADKASAAASLA
jgi:hypothetical protein